MKCKYCDKKRNHYIFNRRNMCPKCRDEYDCYLEEKADAERDERLIEMKRERENE